MTPIQPAATTPTMRPAPPPAVAPVQPAPSAQGHRESKAGDEDRRRDERARTTPPTVLYGPGGRRETSIPGSTVSVIA